MSAAEQIEPRFNIKEAAEFLQKECGIGHMNYHVVRRLADAKRLPFRKIGGTRIIKRSSLIKWLDEQQVEADRESARAADARTRRPRRR